MLTERSESSAIDPPNSIFTKVLFGHQPSPELLAILVVYAVQGILGISRLAVSFFLKDELALSPAEVAALMGIAAIPWVIKPVFGFISDGLPIFGYRRRPYLILSGLLGVGAWLSLAYLVHTAATATIAIAITSLSVAFTARRLGRAGQCSACVASAECANRARSAQRARFQRHLFRWFHPIRERC